MNNAEVFQDLNTNSLGQIEGGGGGEERVILFEKNILETKNYAVTHRTAEVNNN